MSDWSPEDEAALRVVARLSDFVSFFYKYAESEPRFSFGDYVRIWWEENPHTYSVALGDSCVASGPGSYAIGDHTRSVVDVKLRGS